MDGNLACAAVAASETYVLRSQAKVGAALSRLKSLGPVNEAEVALVSRLGGLGRSYPAGREWPSITDERSPVLIVRGWACRALILPDGRRQIFDFLIPGDIVSVSSQAHAFDPIRLFALTNVEAADASNLMAAASDGAHYPRLAHLLRVSRSLDGARLMDLVVSLGKRSAKERVAGLLLDLHDRLRAAGMGDGRSFPLPLSQDTMADALGLSLVHVNRTLQLLRRENLIELRCGQATILDPSGLVQAAGRPTVRQAALAVMPP